MGIENRGFASMHPEKRREIASSGGRAAHRRGSAHEWTREEARDAARKRHARQRRTPGSGALSESVAANPRKR
jgi:general stress protein YciG